MQAIKINREHRKLPQNSPHSFKTPYLVAGKPYISTPRIVVFQLSETIVTDG